MRLRLAFGLVSACLLACSPQPGRVRVTVVFENETQTKCIRASARVEGGTEVFSAPVPRGTKDTFLIGLGETNDLQGEVRVSVSRFTSTDCSGTAFDSESKTVTLVRDGSVGMLEFRFTGAGQDGGVDGGTDGGLDGGLDAGCNPSSCGNAPGECETMPATGCSADGGCRFTQLQTGTACGTAGACNAQGVCVANACTVLAEGAPCEDQLACTSNSTCFNGQCSGGCAPAPSCQRTNPTITCNGNACATTADPDGTSCSSPVNGACLTGTCRAWLPFGPRNFDDGGITAVAYPTDAWTIGDGGTCDTIISTSGSAATVLDGGCGSPVITSTVSSAGFSVITMTALDVASNAKLHFVGDRPVQLVVLGNATIRGLISVSPTVEGLAPAGSPSAACTTAENGDASDEGGGGGGFGAQGGQGGDTGGMGGGPNPSSALPLRAGCPGGSGRRASGSSAGGVGGGAIQLIVRDTLSFEAGGVIAASGGGGAAGTGDGEGGGGGGSGGTVLLHADVINLANGAVTANGGGGGEGGDSGQTSDPGQMGPLAANAAAPGGNSTGSTGGAGGTGGHGSSLAGGAGGNSGSNRGGGGGGGSVGVIHVQARTCMRGSGVLSGFQPSSINCP